MKDIHDDIEETAQKIGYTVINSQEDLDNLFSDIDASPRHVKIYYRCLFLATEYLHPKQIYRYLLKWPAQRVVRGYDDRELWNLEQTIAKFIVPRLKSFISSSQGCPGSLVSDDLVESIDSGSREWQKILAEILWTMEFVAAHYGEDWDDYPWKDSDKQEALSARYKSGMKLFAKYFANLWD